LHPGSIPGEASNFFHPRSLCSRSGLRLSFADDRAKSILSLRTEDDVTLDFAALRRNMVEGQVRTYDVTEARLIAALETIPRERFVPEARRAVAYIDQPVPLSPLRTMLTPMVFARLVQALDIEPSDLILDIACGSGYSSAVLAQLGAKVVALDDDSAAADLSRNVADLAAPGQIVAVNGPLDRGAADHGPFNVILINGALEEAPENLFSQLKEGGRLGCVIGAGRSGKAMIFRKSGNHVSGAPVFDAAAPLLQSFRKAPGFVF
jgi:protein-L-isoaspartate(D-aspartate) O-methyltransferase